MIKALIFDFDGLILETEGPIFQSWRELYQSYGLDLPFLTWAETIGTSDGPFDPYLDLEQRLGKPVDWEIVGKQRQQRELEIIQMQAPLPGVEQLLRDAYDLGLKIGLASSSSCDWVQMHLSRLDLIKFFDCIYGKDDVRITKPDPELYESVLQALGARPDEAIVFEDSPNGILAAKRAGIFCVAVPNHLTQQLQLDQADLRLDSLADLSLQEILLAHQRSST